MEAKRIIEILGGWVKMESILTVNKIGQMCLDKKPRIYVVLDIMEEYGDIAINESRMLGPYESEDGRDMIFDELVEWVKQ